MKFVTRLSVVAVAASPVLFSSASFGALTSAQISGFSTSASATAGNVVSDTNGGAGYTFDGSTGIAYNYGSLGSSGSTVMYLLNFPTFAGPSTAIGNVGDNSGAGDVLKFEQYANTMVLGATQPGIADYNLNGSVSPYNQDVLLSFVNKSDGSIEVYQNASDIGNIAATSGTPFVLTGGTGILGAGGQLTQDPVLGTVYGVATFSAPLSGDQISSIYSAESNPTTPEPASLSLLGFGAVGLLARRRRNRA